MLKSPEQVTPELRTAVKALYKPPFRFYGGYIHDDNGNMVADNHDVGQNLLRIRGWGRIQYMTEVKPEDLQDSVGFLIAELLTKYWDEL